jgi:cytidine deaminase
MSSVPWSEIFAAAAAAREMAWAPYSEFRVGAAIYCTDGFIVSGCNVENASYGLTVCAERNAVAAMTLGGRTPAAVGLIVDAKDPVAPCGACRQVLAEFAGASLAVTARTVSGQEASWTLGELLPSAFTRHQL